jgi:hypothetical protein
VFLYIVSNTELWTRGWLTPKIACAGPLLAEIITLGLGIFGKLAIAKWFENLPPLRSTWL